MDITVPGVTKEQLDATIEVTEDLISAAIKFVHAVDLPKPDDVQRAAFKMLEQAVVSYLTLVDKEIKP
jgi:hypothetical protein